MVKVELIEETRSRTFKPIFVQSWAQTSFPKEGRLLIYSMRTATPLEAEVIKIQPVEECELVFNRESFKEFAKLVKDLDKWFDDHPPEEKDIEAHITELSSEEFLRLWAKPPKDTE
jgi:hypothetical protein